MKQNINLDNPIHQLILLKLTLMCYISGDCKDVYEDEELSKLIEQEFGVTNDDEMAEFLGRDDVEGYYSNWSKLRVTNNFLPEPVYTNLPPEDFIKYQDRVIVKKGGVEYIVYYDEGDDSLGDSWAVFESLPEDKCGSDDPPTHEFTSYEALYDWYNGESLSQQEMCFEH